MRFHVLTLLLAALTLAAPTDLVKRQSSRDEFVNQPCSEIILFYVRGTTEWGNVGWLIGPQFVGALEERLGADRLAIQGVEYPAAIVTNVIPSGASPEGVRNLRDLLNEANQRCPDSILLASGYSQGAAIVHKVFEDGLSASVKQQIAGIVLFGDTRRLQTGGRIAGYPADRTLVICNVGDLVCVGTLVITPAHIGYPARVPEAVDFMEARIQAVAI